MKIKDDKNTNDQDIATDIEEINKDDFILFNRKNFKSSREN
jgi:hypothetical protein